MGNVKSLFIKIKTLKCQDGENELVAQIYGLEKFQLDRGSILETAELKTEKEK